MVAIWGALIRREHAHTICLVFFPGDKFFAGTIRILFCLNLFFFVLS